MSVSQEITIASLEEGLAYLLAEAAVAYRYGLDDILAGLVSAILQWNPGQPDALLWFALLLHRQQRREQAQQFLERALAASPDPQAAQKTFEALSRS